MKPLFVLNCAIVAVMCVCHPSFAQTASASGWAFLCPDGSAPRSDGSCNRGSSSSGSSSAANAAAEAAEREREAAYYREAKARRDAAIADSIRRAKARAAQSEAADEEKRREFQAAKSAGLAELKADLGNFDLREAVAGGALKEESSGGGTRSAKQRTAYGQALCGLGLLQKAMGELESGRDFAAAERRFKIDQAAILFDGGKGEITCAPPPDVVLPQSADMERLIASEKKLLAHVKRYVNELSPAPARPLTAYEEQVENAFRKQKENEGAYAQKDSAVIATQAKINEKQALKYDPKDARHIKREQQEKETLKQGIDQAAESLKKGDVEKVISITGDLDAILSGQSRSGGNSSPKSGPANSTHKVRK